MTSIFEVKCITNLHIGTSGNAYSVIKNEVEKDVVLNTPILPASGIKGTLRDYWRQNCKDKGNEIEIFGTDPIEKNAGKKGKCKFLNGQLILRPMRVSWGDYAYCLVTTPDLIRTMLDTFSAFKFDEYRGVATNFFDNYKIENIFKENDTAGFVYYPQAKIEEVEGYPVKNIEEKIKKNNKDKQENKTQVEVVDKEKYGEIGLYKMLFNLAEGVPIVIMKTDVFKTIDLPIVARNHLIDGKSNNLWYEEIVPHQSRFYFITIWEGEDREIYNIMEKEICKSPISFGGNNSIGNGYCSIENYKPKEEK